MEKYGVKQDEKKIKTSSKEQRCPKCGAILPDREDVNVLKCGNCGTEPFEGD